MGVRKPENRDLHLTWSDAIKTDDRRLVLFNPATLEVVDMIDRHDYIVSSKVSKLLVLYGSDEYVKSKLEDGFPLAGEPFPNPAANLVTIPFRISSASPFKTVSIKAFNSSGTIVANLADGTYGPGVHSVQWRPDQSAGLYLVKIVIGSEEKTFKVVLK